MNTKEAISVLENKDVSLIVVARIGQDPEYWRKLKPALDMALSALRAQQEHTPYELELSPIDQYDGLKRKYIVLKADTGKCVDNCFVLRPDKDAAAVAALRAYAEATDNETLATDIINWVGAEQNAPLTLDELREMVGEPVWIVWPDSRIKSRWWIVGNYDWNTMGFFDTTLTYHCGKSWLAYRHKPEEESHV